MDALQTIVFISIIMWYIIDRFKGLWEAWKYAKYATMLVSALFAFALAFGYNLDLVAALGIAPVSILGTILTALTFMGGSSAVAELVSKLEV